MNIDKLIETVIRSDKFYSICGMIFMAFGLFRINRIAIDPPFRVVAIIMGVGILIVSLAFINKGNKDSKSKSFDERLSKIYKTLSHEEKRILRALIGENEGRILSSFRTHFSQQLNKLEKKGLIILTKANNYRLENDGRIIALEYLKEIVREYS